MVEEIIAGVVANAGEVLIGIHAHGCDAPNFSILAEKVREQLAVDQGTNIALQPAIQVCRSGWIQKPVYELDERLVHTPSLGKLWVVYRIKK